MPAMAQRSGMAESIVPGVSPQIYSEADFERIAQMMRRETGIVLSAKKRMLVYSRIAPLVRASNRQTFAEYLDHAAKDPAMATRTIASLTTNHTYFYREPHHFEHFAQHVRPDLCARIEKGDKVRLWSAGCSSGEEIWTLIMVLLGEKRAHGQRLAQGDILALASDLADHAVEAAKRGIYRADTLETMPEPLRAAWCEREAGGPPEMLGMARELRSLVRFRQLNLFRPWPMKHLFDVIFCRNVMIYFDEPSKEHLLVGLAGQLRPGGYLYIGHSERVSGAARDLLDPAGPTIYRRKAA